MLLRSFQYTQEKTLCQSASSLPIADVTCFGEPEDVPSYINSVYIHPPSFIKMLVNDQVMVLPSGKLT